MTTSKGSRKFYYLDNAASTPIDKKVAKEMVQAAELYGNPSSYNDCGREAREYIEHARLRVARFLGAHSDEIVFTSSGSEANNLAIQGIARNFQFSIFPDGKAIEDPRQSRDNFQRKPKPQKLKPHIVTTQIEHPSVLKPIEWLEENGSEVTYLSVDKEGFVDLDELQKALKPGTILVSVMYANNEIGTTEPIVEIGKIISDFNKKLEIGNWKLKIGETRRVLFHTDACQATEYLNMNVNHLGVDLLTFNGSKIYGPRGLGILYVKRGVRISPVIMGGEQELGLRAGTENLPAIGGLAVAIDRIDKKEGERLTGLRDYFIKKIKELLPDVVVNGPVDNRHRKSVIHRLPNNINISVPDLSSEVLLLELDKYGICAGSGSACTSHAVEPSHVLKAIEVEPRYINGALRFSMGRYTTKRDIDYALNVLPKIVKDLKKRYGKI